MTLTCAVIGSLPFVALIRIVVDDWLKKRARDKVIDEVAEHDALRSFTNPGRR